jgi:hypothetical protein
MDGGRAVRVGALDNTTVDSALWSMRDRRPVVSGPRESPERWFLIVIVSFFVLVSGCVCGPYILEALSAALAR